MSNTEDQIAIGIDLGTTNSCVAVFVNGKVEVIANSQGNRTTPSIVAFTDKERLIGEAALVEGWSSPENTISNAKRFIGRSRKDVEDNINKFPFNIIEDEKGLKFEVEFLKKRQAFLPEEISGYLLSYMKKTAEDYLGFEVKNAVITVPAYFNDQQRSLTKIAGEIAGLNVLRIINEPTAAALAYGIQEDQFIEGKKGQTKHVLVYDLGGGTFDVSVLEIGSDVEVKATYGNTELGGEDFNHLIFTHFKKEIFREHKTDLLTGNKQPERRLAEACEKLKKNLSSEFSTTSSLVLESFPSKGKRYKLTLSRAKLEDVCRDLFKKTILGLDQVLQDAKIDKSRICEVILVGGSTRIPKIRALIREYFNDKELNVSINADEAVAFGAAVQAAILSGQFHSSFESIILIDVNPLSLGWVNGHGINRVIIPRNSTIPVRITALCRTSQHYQTGGTFIVVEGERPLAADNIQLGVFRVSGFPKKMAGEVKFDLTYEIDENGILKVTAKMVGGDCTGGITIDSKKRRHTVDEVEELVKKAAEMNIRDEQEANRAIAKHRLIFLCHDIRFRISDLGTVNLSLVAEYEAWLGNNPEATEQEYNAKSEELSEKVGSSLTNKTTYKSEYKSWQMYYQAGKLQMQIGNIKEAARMFMNGIFLAEKNPHTSLQACSALGESYMKLAKSEPKSKYISEAAYWLIFSLIFSPTKEMKDEIITNIEQVYRHMKEHLKENRGIVSRFCHQLCNVKDCEDEKWIKIVKNCCFDLLGTVVTESKSELEDNTVDTPVLVFKALNDPSTALALEKLKHLENNEKLCVDDCDRLKEIIVSLNEVKGWAVDLKTLKKCETDFETVSKIKSEGLKLINTIDRIDQLASTRGLEVVDRKSYCKTRCLEGRYLCLIFLTERAKECFYEVSQMASQWSSEPFYTTFKAKIDEIEKAEKLCENTSVKEDDLKIELDEEIKFLNGIENISNSEFVKQLWARLPPKHGEFTQPEVKAGCSELNVFKQFASIYHPDRVNKQKYGAKYKLLCSEISKRINSRFNKLK